MKPTFLVEIKSPEGIRSTLSHRGRLSWTKATARKHAADYLKRHPGGTAEVKEW